MNLCTDYALISCELDLLVTILIQFIALASHWRENTNRATRAEKRAM